MSHFGTIHSLDDAGLPGLCVTHTNPPVTFEFDNFGVTQQRLSAETLAASSPDTSEQLGNAAEQTEPADSRAERRLRLEGDLPETDSCLPKEGDADQQTEQTTGCEQTEAGSTETNDGPVIDIAINNVVCSFSTRCHLDLKKIAMTGMNVIHKKESGMVSMKLRKPYTTASVWSSGKITCTGATSEDEAKKAARRFARAIQKLGFNTKVANFRIVNVLGTCSLPFAIKITTFSQDYPREASYEPELHPGVTYKLKEPKATLKIFSTGSITVTAPRVANVQAAIEHIFPIVFNYRMDKAEVDSSQFSGAQIATLPVCHKKRERTERQGYLIKKRQRFDDSDEEDWTDTTNEDDDEDIDSDLESDY